MELKHYFICMAVIVSVGLGCQAVSDIQKTKCRMQVAAQMGDKVNSEVINEVCK